MCTETNDQLDINNTAIQRIKAIFERHGENLSSLDTLNKITQWIETNTIGKVKKLSLGEMSKYVRKMAFDLNLYLGDIHPEYLDNNNYKELIYTAQDAVIKYLLSEIIDVAGCVTISHGKSMITEEYVNESLFNDDELYFTFINNL